MTTIAPRSLLGQFVLLHAVTALIAAIALTLGASALLHGTADHYQQDLLRRQAIIVATSLAPGAVRSRGHAVLADGMAVAVIGRDRAVGDAEGPDRPAMIAAAPLDRTPRYFRRGGVGGLSLPVSGGWIVVSQDDASPEVVTDDIVRAFLKRFALLSLPIAALVPLIGAILTGRLTRRMQAVSAIAAGIGPSNLDVRIPIGTLPSEVEPLAVATNEALDRLAGGFRTQAAFAADIAHELRTPLAVTRLRADAVADPDARAALLAAVDRAARVITQLLALADLERPLDDTGTMIDLRALAEDVIADRAPVILASGRSIALEESGPLVAILGHAAPIALALENLLDNATRHTPRGTAIVVRAGPGARLSVIDDGDGVPPDQLPRLKDRFWRADGSHAEGSGIGLSIVQRIAAAHRGALDIAPGPGQRGLAFTLRFGPDDGNL